MIVSVPVVEGEGLAPLADVDDEAQAVSQVFVASRWLHGSTATLARIRSELPGKSLFHFAGHAIASPQRTGLGYRPAPLAYFRAVATSPKTQISLTSAARAAVIVVVARRTSKTTTERPAKDSESA